MGDDDGFALGFPFSVLRIRAICHSLLGAMLVWEVIALKCHGKLL